MKKKNILIIGAKSKVGIEIAEKFSKNNFNILLAGRNIKQIEKKKKYLEKNYKCKVELIEFDILKIGKHNLFLKDISHLVSKLAYNKNSNKKNMALPDVIVLTVGKLILKKSNRDYYREIHEEMLVNYLCPALLIELFSNKLLKLNRKSTIIAFSSVAGERGRALNYSYGSAKSGLSQFLSGLRQKTSNSLLNIITIIPGYIDTKMSEKVKKSKILTSSTKEVAELVFSAYKSGSNIIYTKYWRFIMYAVKALPEFIFKKLKF